MRRLVLNCKIITPLFMGGATQKPELRTQSFNGLFRYWFRLLGGGFEDEKRLFGWGGEKANKGIVRVYINQYKTSKLSKTLFSKIFDDKKRVRNDLGINYIGFSLDQRFKSDQEDKTRREYLKENQWFYIDFYFHPISIDEDVKKFLCAVWCAFYLGNFGSRSRRGFGSIMVEDINGNIPEDFKLKFKPEQNQSINDWLKNQLNYIKSLNYWRARGEIPYIFENLEVYKISKNNLNSLEKWTKRVQGGRKGKYLVEKWGLSEKGEVTINVLHDLMGFLLLAYRSYYQPDYKIAKAIIGKENAKIHKNPTIERVIFGLPLNFYFSSIEKGKQVEARLNDESLRRASPIIFKIIQFNNNFEGFILVFKPNDRHNFKFLPDGARINLAGVNLNQPNWQILDRFINSLEAENLITKVYP